MILQKELTDRLSQLKNYAVTQGKNSAMVSTLVAPLEAAITSYYRMTGIEDEVVSCILSLTHSLLVSGMEYEDGSKSELDTSDAPAGYFDITELFNVGNDLLNTKVGDFNASIKLTQVMAEDGVTVASEHYESKLVDAWVAEFTAELDPETGLLSKISAISFYASSGKLSDPIKSVMEPSRIKSVPDKVEVAKEIYWNRKYQDLINLWNLGVYIPTFCRNRR